jgi:hypothetical protein
MCTMQVWTTVTGLRKALEAVAACDEDVVVAKNSSDRSSSPRVPVVKPSDSRKGDDTARTRRLDDARDRRITVEGHVGPILVVVSSVGSNQTAQMALPEYDDVVEELAPERANKPFGVAVLPGDRGAVLICRMPRWCTRESNAKPIA